MKKTSLFLSLILLVTASIFSQGVSINSTGNDPDISAGLDVNFANKGLLIPQIALSDKYDATTIPNPAISLLIFNTATNAGLTPGYFYNSGTTASPFWTRLATGIVDGSETKVTSGSNIWITGNGSTSNPYVINATDGGGVFTHYVGENYGGGIVFYVYDGGQHGLIAAPVDQSSGIRWSSDSYTGIMSKADGINGGISNTSIIIANQADGDGQSYAARLCHEYKGGNFGDWYLPSKYELNLLYLQKELIAPYAYYNYWSSTENDEGYSNNGAWNQDFSTGYQSIVQKYYQFNVRAIRAF
jgi:hypothetical protein